MIEGHDIAPIAALAGPLALAALLLLNALLLWPMRHKLSRALGGPAHRAGRLIGNPSGNPQTRPLRPHGTRALHRAASAFQARLAA
ncbi:hypothetical protein ACUJ46_07425 [Sandaracinobacteroides sp. A072]|uniref:hypothetical protein n=1 Tax=Sandaracinobacteroides sp. A072 TaxID=3461146 RepID=UPI004042DADF